jgi:hypothetical protein
MERPGANETKASSASRLAGVVTVIKLGTPYVAALAAITELLKELVRLFGSLA